MPASRSRCPVRCPPCRGARPPYRRSAVAVLARLTAPRRPAAWCGPADAARAGRHRGPWPSPGTTCSPGRSSAAGAAEVRYLPAALVPPGARWPSRPRSRRWRPAGAGRRAAGRRPAGARRADRRSPPPCPPGTGPWPCRVGRRRSAPGGRRPGRRRPVVPACPAPRAGDGGRGGAARRLPAGRAGGGGRRGRRGRHGGGARPTRPGSPSPWPRARSCSRWPGLTRRCACARPAVRSAEAGGEQQQHETPTTSR